ncbi:MAG: nucleotidyltransferase domain-containing protein [Candidatus Margulisbacteria bacterium]|jgi:predicted nucleotidyltransferase|nr:nucleotidyltransferase domain-containing protein [Candidatus Margulisiibacteriota bacterium]
MPELFIDRKSLETIRAVIGRLCPEAEVWAYGSRVDGTAHEASDLDLAVVDFGRSGGSIAALRAALQESNVPFLIDLFDFHALPENFQEEIKRRHTVLCSGASNKSVK